MKISCIILFLVCLPVACSLASNEEHPSWRPLPLLPGAKVFDVTKEPFNAIPDDDIDDTHAIQAAITAAAEMHEKAEDEKLTLQQIIYLPAGTYLLSDTLACQLNRVNSAHASFQIKASEAYQWIKGDGAGKTVLRLRSAEDIGIFGSPEAPKPVLQTARYAYDRKQSGNIKFQLWVTDLSVVVPGDQPHAVGLSYGVANMGAVRRVHIQAEGEAGHVGLALVQNNNGPGLIEEVCIEGFSTGIEINDASGKNFYLKNIKLLNQRPRGVGFAVSDKIIGVENMVIHQQHADVTGVSLRNTRSESSTTGGMAHLTILSPHFQYTGRGEASAPAINIKQGHLYMRGAEFKNYGNQPIRDHGKPRKGTNGELVLVHGRSMEEEPNVVVTVDGAPAQSLNLPLKPTPKIPERAWEQLESGDVTTVSKNDLRKSKLAVSTAWVIVQPAGDGDDTELLQAALDSGARYVGLINDKAFFAKDTLHVNRPGTPGNVELIYGHMTDIILTGPIYREAPFIESNEHVGIHLHTGRHEEFFLKGIRFAGVVPKGHHWGAEDFQVLQNDAASTVVMVDVRAKSGPKAYRNGQLSEGQEVYFDNVEFAYSRAFPQEMLIFKNQSVWARNLNVEMPVMDREYFLPEMGKESQRFLSATTAPRMVNDGGRLFTIGQKVGEHSGPFMLTAGGGRTELLSLFLNQKTSLYLEPSHDAAILILEGQNSACSLVGAERTRNQEYPHNNAFARLKAEGEERLIPCTDFPTLRRYDGYDPFEDKDEQRYLTDLTHRVFGLFRAGDAWQQAASIAETIEEPKFPENIFNVLDLGAVGDGVHNDLPALQTALEQCSTAGGGTVVVPAGVYWLEGPLNLKSNVNLHLEEGSRLRFSAHPPDFLPVVFTRWEGTEMYGYSPFIYAKDCSNIAITGRGVIDGNAGDTFGAWRERQKEDQNTLRSMGDKEVPIEQRIFGEGHWLRPSFIQFINCSRIKLDGVRIINSPFWIIHPVYSSHITIRDVDIESMRLNNDGLDIDSSTYVLVENSTFRTGDDAVVIKSGRDKEGRRIGRPSENILIRNNTLLKVHNGIAIGSEMSGSVRNVFIENCTVKSGRNLIYFKSNLDRGGVVENVHVRNIKVEQASQNLIRFQTDYHSYRGGNYPPRFRNFHIENVNCEEAATGIRVEGHPDAPITNVSICDVTVKVADIALVKNEHDQVDLEDVFINDKRLSSK